MKNNKMYYTNIKDLDSSWTEVGKDCIHETMENYKENLECGYHVGVEFNDGVFETLVENEKSFT